MGVSLNVKEEELFQDWKEVDKQDVLYLLEQLKELFSDESNWIDWPEAVDAQGYPTGPSSSEAKKWNLLGASTKITDAKYQAPLAQFVECATKEYLYSLIDEPIIGKMLSYDNEFALICLGLEYLQ